MNDRKFTRALVSRLPEEALQDLEYLLPEEVRQARLALVRCSILRDALDWLARKRAKAARKAKG
jgi:hypothetical protein